MHRHAIYFLLLTVFGLTGLGMVMLSSTGAFALESRGDMYYFLKRQGMWLGISLVAATVAGTLDYSLWKRLWPLVFGVTFVLLLLCFVPPFGMRINGSSRWVNLGFATFQPSELAKVAVIMFLAWWLERHEPRVRTFVWGFLIPLAVVGILAVPILFEVDFGSTALLFAVALSVLFLAGANLWILGSMAVVGLLLMFYLATHVDERLARIMAFLDPEKYRLSEGLQQWQALIAFGSGGVDGQGLGAGRQKMLYLPYAHTDFIFPMIGEELGLKFTLLTVGGFLLICLCGVQVALNARDRFGTLLGFGCVVMITIQAAVNIGVTTSLLPNKGMPLPFISFGGSDLLICYIMVGLLVSIHRHGRPHERPVSHALGRATSTYCKL